MKKYRCIVCAEVIPAERAARAVARSMLPRYCSATCYNTFTRRAYRKRKKDEQ